MIYTNPNDKTITKEQAEFMGEYGLEAVQQYPDRLYESISACGGPRPSVLHTADDSAKSVLCTGHWESSVERK